MRYLTAQVIAGIVLALSVTGCPAPSTGGNDTGIADRDEFTAERQAAVSLVVEQVIAACQAFSALNALSDPRLTVGGAAYGQFGTCPEVTFIGSAGSATNIRIDYGDGCSAAATGSLVLSGVVNITTSVTGGQFRIQFDDLQIDDRELDGLFEARRTTGEDGRTTLEGHCDLETSDVGTFRGIVRVELAADGGLGLTAESTYVSDDDTFYLVRLSALAAEPLEYDNVIPADGTLAFVDEELVRIDVTFFRRSAEEGLVQVLVGNGSVLNYQVVNVPN